MISNVNVWLSVLRDVLLSKNFDGTHEYLTVLNSYVGFVECVTTLADVKTEEVPWEVYGDG